METKLTSSNTALEESWARIVVLNDEKEKGIDDYMLTPEFKELMKEYDALVHPLSYKEGWDVAVETLFPLPPERS